MHIKPQDLVNSRELLNQLGHAHHDLVQEKTDMTNDVPTTCTNKTVVVQATCTSLLMTFHSVMTERY